MRIRMFDEKQDLSDFLLLFKDSFEETMSKDDFDWKYTRNPFRIDRIPILIAEENERVVGARPFMATRMSIRGEVASVLQPCDTMVHPEFRGRGIFSQMNQFAIEEFQRQGYRIFYNFPNQMSYPGYMKSGWQVISETNWQWKILNPGRVFDAAFKNHVIRNVGRLLSPVLWYKTRVPKFQEPGVTAESVDDTGMLEKVFLEWKNEVGVFTCRDRQYLDWRFRSHPERHYSFVVIQAGGQIKGYVVFSIADFKGLKRGSIVDYLVIDDNPGTFRSLLVYSLNLLKDRGCDVVDTWAYTQEWAERIIAGCGFISSKNILVRRWFANGRLVARPVDKQHFPYDLSRMKWYITPSDHDSF